MEADLNTHSSQSPNNLSKNIKIIVLNSNPKINISSHESNLI